MFCAYHLSTGFHEQVVVTDHFYLKPLLLRSSKMMGASLSWSSLNV
jgi:hypothetical protein